ncbi:Ppx/GppA phosphatase family protein [Pseudofulvibacter geojedonensis]|uniref:Ppx/GppA phosphatase family protein n=1 Tax=Pseudofulvibacter geojedonensis TaxID=1123758 RepID=A0ABW3HY25_9FLAO
MIIKKYAAIDIGSNAVRMLIANVIEEEGKRPNFKKSSLIRVPIRLGQDAFTVGTISPEKIIKMKDTMMAFKLLMKSHGVEKYMACATSAMREANNGKDIALAIKETSDIDIEIIDGKKEAAIIASTDLKTFIDPDKNYLYVDVGGGSTEFTVFSRGKIINSKSFKIGTVRLINESITEEVWNNIESWIKKNTNAYEKITMIGSGGNINKIHKLSGKTTDRPLSYVFLNAQYHFFNAMSYADRISEIGLNPDRADVIIPALKIYLNAMKWSKSKKVYVPKIGLSDGIIKTLYYSDK